LNKLRTSGRAQQAGSYSLSQEQKVWLVQRVLTALFGEDPIEKIL